MQREASTDGRLFEPGRVVFTPAAMEVFDRTGAPFAKIRDVLERHLAGDWGDVDEEDVAENDRSVS